MTALARGVSQKHRHHRHDRHAGVRVTVAAVGRGYPKTAVTTVTAVTPKDGHPPKERRNPPMPYAILRFQKRKAGGVAACERHNERKKEAYKSNPDIDMERSKNNYHLIAPPKYTYKKEINRMVAEAGCRTRKDSVMMVETLITASPEFMNQLPPEEQKRISRRLLTSFRSVLESRISSPLSSIWTRERPICTSALCRLRQTISCQRKLS